MQKSSFVPFRLIKRQKEVQQKSYAWHSHDAREVLAVLDTSVEGLTEKAIKERREKYGLNKFTEIKPPGLISKFIKQFQSPIVLVLLAAFVVTAFLHEFVDSGVIMAALLIAVIVGVLQENKADKAFRTLTKSQTHSTIVIRQGEKHEISIEELVPGDIVEMESGSGVPADLRLLETKNLSINEAALTGEWRAVEKQANAVSVGLSKSEQSNMAWLGSFVSSGYGFGVVVATGDSTMMGELAKSVQTIKEEDTPLQIQMQKLSKVMLIIIATIVTFVFGIGIMMGESMSEMLLVSIAVAVASVPEGLPAAVTIILAVGMESLLKRGGLVRNLLAAETLGSTTYILTDKTGTLTKGKMSLTGIIIGTNRNLNHASWKEGSDEYQMINVALCATNAFADTSNGESIIRGEAVERAVFSAADDLGLTTDEGSFRNQRVDYLPFSSEQRFAAGLATDKDEYRLCVNGAPEELLSLSKFIATKNGVEKASAELKTEILAAIEAETREGRRLIGVGYKLVNDDEIDETDKEQLLGSLVFGGLLILSDPVRSDVKKAIAGVKEAGAEVLLITGDNPETALSVAKAVGIAADSSTALTGTDLDELNDDELYEAIEHVRVFARVLPQQKMRIAGLLQLKGEIVAMTGDGINDAPALRKANIGVAVGSGTEVAKESSDLVLLNDSFDIIYAAIEEGRRIVSNLKKIVSYLMATSLSEVVLISAALITGGAVPILPTQILWANIIEEGLMSVAFAFEKGERNAMKRPPRDVHEEGVMSVDVLWFMAFVVTVLSTLLLVLYFYFRLIVEVPIEELRSIMFLSVAIDSLFMAFAFRSLSTPIWSTPLRDNLFFIGSFLMSSLLLLGALSLPFMQYVLSYQPLSLPNLLIVLGFGGLTLLTIELGKWVFFKE